MNKKIKNIINNKYFIIVLIILLMTLVIGTGTYAWLTWSSPSSTNMTVTIGNIADVIFGNGKEINTTNLAPVFTSDQGEKTNFSIVKRKNAQSTNISYTVTLDIISIADELKTSSFKYVLLNKNTNTVVSTGDFSTVTNSSTITLYSGILSGTRIDHDFIIYIDGNEENNINMMNKTFKASLDVSASISTAVGTVNFADYISELYTNTDSSSVNSVTYNNIEYVYDTTNSLMDDNYSNIRYYGSSPNNYVYFNCDDYSNQSAATCELWRVIGVYNSLSTPDPLVKIIRDDIIDDYEWDSLANHNGWTDAGLQKLLNYDYMIGNTGDCTFDSSRTCDFSSTGLKIDTTRNMIYENEWSISPITSDLSSAYPDNIYDEEMNMDSIWTGKIALMYLSEYIYASDFSQCYDAVIANYSDTVCASSNWLVKNSVEWTISNYNGNYNQIFYIGHDGNINTDDSVTAKHGFRPTLYLRYEQEIQGGDGTFDNPYQLYVE